jgi:hypothetical protein
MGFHKATPIFGFAWEAIRFFFLIALVLQVLQPTSPDPAGLAIWLLFLAAPQLAVPACFLFLALYPVSYAALLNPLRVAKLLAVFTTMLLILSGTVFSANAYPIRILGLDIPAAIGVMAVLAVDSLILLLLLLWKRKTPPEPGKEGPPLPAYSETEVKGIE